MTRSTLSWLLVAVAVIAGCRDMPKEGEHWEYNLPGVNESHKLELVCTSGACAYAQDGVEVVARDKIGYPGRSPDSADRSPKLLFVANHGFAFVDRQGMCHFDGKLIPGVKSGFALSRDAHLPSGTWADGSSDFHSDTLAVALELPTYVVSRETANHDPGETVGWGTEVSASRYDRIVYLGLAKGIVSGGLPIWIGMTVKVTRTESETTRLQSFEIGAFGRSPTPLDCSVIKDAPIGDPNGLNYLQVVLMVRDQEGGNTYSVMSRPGIVNVCGGARLVYVASRESCMNDATGNLVCIERFVMRIGDSEFPIASPAKS